MHTRIVKFRRVQGFLRDARAHRQRTHEYSNN